MSPPFFIQFGLPENISAEGGRPSLPFAHIRLFFPLYLLYLMFKQHHLLGEFLVLALEV